MPRRLGATVKARNDANDGGWKDGWVCREEGHSNDETREKERNVDNLFLFFFLLLFCLFLVRDGRRVKTSNSSSAEGCLSCRGRQSTF